MATHIWKAARQPRILRLRVRGVRNERCIATDSRNRLSKFWAPTGGISPPDGEQDESHALLVRGGFLRQAHSGVFHLLPLGLRVQNKLEALIEKHMCSIGASKLALSSITTETLWRQSGRYSANSELLRIKDRRESGFLLSPTHEEEITALVAGMVHSYKDLPLRLYQIGRKYRDERRPRQGLLRAKEFMMKDLYTFDHSSDAALKTYEAVREAYNNLFNELKLPYLVADADSGNMGGKLSHEYHFVSPKGEDNVWSCNSCSYVVNEELVEKRTETAAPGSIDIVVSTGISVDKSTAINIHIPNPASTTQSEVIEWDQISDFINLHAVKKALPEGVEIDTGIESATLNGLLHKTTQTIDLFDRSLSSAPNSDSNSPSTNVDLTVTKLGDACPHCSNGKLHVQRAIEVAHTFHLGTRYSSPLNAVVALPDQNLSSPIQMGCHGIGVSRIIGAVASLLSDSKGLNWPRAIAPYDTIIIPSPQMKDQDADVVHDVLLSGTNGKVDIVLDDRAGKSLGWKLKDADLIGYPVVVVVGRGWKEKREVEVQCRRLGVRKEIWVGELKSEIMGLLEQL